MENPVIQTGNSKTDFYIALIQSYLTEVVEILIALLLITILNPDKPNDYPKIIKMAFMIAIFTTILNYYSADYNKSLKSSMIVVLGNSLIQM